MSIAVIAGLGNPGAEYEHTRHNLGFWLADLLACDQGAQWRADSRHRASVARFENAGRTVWLIKPQTFMNDSGNAVAPFLHFHKFPPSALAVLHDDITLPLGRLKIAVGGSAGGHHGIASLLAHVGPDFVRVKLGIGGKTSPELDLADHVLGRLAPDEDSVLDSRIPHFLAGLKILLLDGPVTAMNHFNRQPPLQPPTPSAN